jgi:hypothetical protein
MFVGLSSGPWLQFSSSKYHHTDNIGIEDFRRSVLNILVHIHHCVEADGGHMEHVLHVTDCGFTFCYITVETKAIKTYNSPFVKTLYLEQNSS